MVASKLIGGSLAPSQDSIRVQNGSDYRALRQPEERLSTGTGACLRISIKDSRTLYCRLATRLIRHLPFFRLERRLSSQIRTIMGSPRVLRCTGVVLCHSTCQSFFSPALVSLISDDVIAHRPLQLALIEDNGMVEQARRSCQLIAWLRRSVTDFSAYPLGWMTKLPLISLSFYTMCCSHQ
jgi:hypothetical protein